MHFNGEHLSSAGSGRSMSRHEDNLLIGLNNALLNTSGKETGGKKMEDPHSLKSNEMAEVVFEPIQPLVVDSFKNCEGLSRVALMEGNGVVMLGKCVSTVAKDVK
mmetsp:Transcript_13457/g.11282  ORF Transcript_13457/g.11282 Transcript_13457/m.11282 type:complete len:105 (+) Transcript_13457:223-537(+)